MTGKQITIDFLPDGSIEMDGQGFKGVECDKAMAVFEKALGVVKTRKNKPEYQQRAAQGAQQTQAQ